MAGISLGKDVIHLSGGDGSVIIEVNLDADEIEKELARVKKKILDLESSIGEKQFKQNALKKSLEEANAELAELESRVTNVENKDEISPIDMDNLDEVKVQISQIEGEIQGYGAAIEKSNQSLDFAKERYAELTKEAEQFRETAEEGTDAQDKMSDAINRAGQMMDNFTSRVKKLASRIFIFTLITKALSSIKEWIADVIAVNDEAQASIAQLKGALLTLAQPLVEVVIPAFISFVNILTKAVTALARVMSNLFGTTIEDSAAAAKALYDEQQALKGVNDEASEASKSLAGFDDLNVMDSGGDTGSGDSDLTSGTAPDFSSLVGNSIDAVTELFSGVALLALGAILTFTGASVPLGLGLMVAGAALVYDAVTENWGAIETALQSSLGAVFAVVSIAFLVIGAILAFTGANIPLGIGLMAIGALGLGAVIAANWDAIKDALDGPIGAVMGLVGTAFLVLGAILAFSGANLPLGIGLLALGAALAGGAAAAGVNWDTIKDALEGPIGVVTAAVGIAALAIGAILAFSGANLFLGIGLMAVGALGLAATVAANWDTIKNALQGPIGAVMALVGAAFLVLGAILAFSGAATHIGIALLALGAASMIGAAAAGVNWDTIKDALQGPIGAVVAVVSIALLAIGAILAFTGANLPLGIGLIAVGALGLAATVTANWDTIIDALQGPLGLVVGIVSAALLVLGIILLFTGAGIPLGIGLIAAGALGLAAAIAPNWDFLLDKLKGMWENIKSWWNTYIVPAFNAVKDFFTGIFTGIWDFIKGVINGILGGIESMANGVIRGINWVIDALNALHFDVPDWVPLLGGKSFGFNITPLSEISIPRLATGAVIPPNKEFLAVLGDQKNGTNIEAPVELIRQVIAEELDKHQSTDTSQPTWVVEGSMSALVRDLRVYMQKADRRVSVRLVEGGI